MLTRLLSALGLGCAHRRISWPQTTPLHGTRVCCLDCGKRLAYSWSEMRVTQDRPARVGPVVAEKI